MGAPAPVSSVAIERPQNTHDVWPGAASPRWTGGSVVGIDFSVVTMLASFIGRLVRRVGIWCHADLVIKNVSGSSNHRDTW
jgi:hypothetical protein